jgi:hypothetical protein
MSQTVSLPATCQRCGLVFASGFTASGEVRELTLAGNLSQCPRCGGMAPVIEGRFDIRQGVIQALDGASAEDLRRVLRILQEETDPTRIVKRIEREAPSAARLVSWLKENRDLATWAAVLIAVIGLCRGPSTEPLPPSVNIVIDLTDEEEPQVTFDGPSRSVTGARKAER